MSVAHQVQLEPQSQYNEILQRALRACLLAQSAAAALADGLVNGNLHECWRTVDNAERELDRLDTEIDLAVTSCIAAVTPEQARELLASMKVVLDVERIGDLLSSVANCAHALGNRVEPDDLSDLVKMSTVLEQMLADIHGAFLARNVEAAIAVLRNDAEIDRLRNLTLIRHLEQAQIRMPQDSIQVLFMVQALERAGDHVKNVAEEICQLATGQTLRHVLHCNDMPQEQMYLRWLKSQLEDKRLQA